MVEYFNTPTIWGWGLTVIFVLVWLTIMGVWRARNRWFWLAIAGAILFVPVVVYIQTPWRNVVNQGLLDALGKDTFMDWYLVVGIPFILIGAVVQEGAKTLPLAFYWLAKRKNITPEQGLLVGAITGAGFALIEAQYLLNSLFASGWTFAEVGNSGLSSLGGLWTRFFVVGFHIGIGAFIGYGMAKGRGWQYYLIAVAAHFVLNYPVLLYDKNLLGIGWVEIIIAVISAGVFFYALWLRWWKEEDKEMLEL